MDLQEYFGTEKLMSFHLLIFVMSILSYFSACIAYKIVYECTQGHCNLIQLCHRVSTWYIIKAIDEYLNVSLLVLFTYLSVKFSKPLNDYQTQFLLMFQTRNLDRVESAAIEYKKAKRYNKAALEHQRLIIWQAFTDDSFCKKSVSGSDANLTLSVLVPKDNDESDGESLAKTYLTGDDSDFLRRDSD